LFLRKTNNRIRHRYVIPMPNLILLSHLIYEIILQGRVVSNTFYLFELDHPTLEILSSFDYIPEAWVILNEICYLVIYVLVIEGLPSLCILHGGC